MDRNVSIRNKYKTFSEKKLCLQHYPSCHGVICKNNSSITLPNRESYILRSC